MFVSSSPPLFLCFFLSPFALHFLSLNFCCVNFVFIGYHPCMKYVLPNSLKAEKDEISLTSLTFVYCENKWDICNYLIYIVSPGLKISLMVVNKSLLVFLYHFVLNITCSYMYVKSPCDVWYNWWFNRKSTQFFSRKQINIWNAT